MALADACLVRMTEQYPRSTVLTLDSDFHIYRKHGRQSIPCLIPDMYFFSHSTEKRAIAVTLIQYQGNTFKTAEVLGISVRTLQRKIKKYRL
jgi:transcriptional regulator with PAS, ATPase and Fis domain